MGICANYDKGVEGGGGDVSGFNGVLQHTKKKKKRTRSISFSGLLNMKNKMLKSMVHMHFPIYTS